MKICVRSLKAYTDSIDENRRTMNVVAVANEGRAALLMLIRSVMKYKQSCEGEITNYTNDIASDCINYDS